MRQPTVLVRCIYDLNIKLCTSGAVDIRLPQGGPRKGGVYRSDGYIYYNQWGFFIHLEEFPEHNCNWNADKFVFEDNQSLNVEEFLCRINGVQYEVRPDICIN